MPEGATVSREGKVTWTARGKKKIGKLSPTGNVSLQVDTWTAQFTDEMGKTRKVPTKTTVRSVAEKILAKYEMDVARIRTGVATREELEKAEAPKITVAEALERFLTKMVADGDTARHVTRTKRNINLIIKDCGIDSLDIRRDAIERWIAHERQRGIRNPRTINGYITSLKTFVQYLTETELLPNHPLKSIRKLNEEIDKRINRRALTKEEINRLLKATASGIERAAGTPEERVLIYRTALATGLRSTELSLLTPGQINFEQCSLTVEAAKTKNKKPDVLPLRADLVQSLKERCETKGIKPHERFFRHDVYNIRKAFYADLKIAGIERAGEDGRSIDVHSLRKTFGTLLAKAGVPLTTVQRLMRHSSPLLTAKLYIDVEGGDMMDALEKLPEFSSD
jgi:integrase